MAARGKKKNPVTVSGAWIPLSLDLLQSRAFAGLSPKGTKMLCDLMSQLRRNGACNGDLSAAPGLMVPRGWRSNADRVAAIQELLDASLIVITRRGNRRLTTLYAITLWPLDTEITSKLEVGPGAYTQFTWRETGNRPGDKVEPKDQDTWVTWHVPRRNEKSVPIVGQPPVDMDPSRDNSRDSSSESVPAMGTQRPV